MISDHGRRVDVDRRHRANHSMLTGEVRPDSDAEGRLTRLGHGLHEFRPTRSNSGVVARPDPTSKYHLLTLNNHTCSAAVGVYLPDKKGVDAFK